MPQDKELETALFHRLNAKKCAVCGALFTPGSNRAKYCPECAARMKRINAAKRKRKQREKCHALGDVYKRQVQYMAASGAPMPTLAAIIAVIMEVPAAILIVLGFFTCLLYTSRCV